MLRRKLFGRRGHVHRSSRSRASVHLAASLAVCETLEPRQLLTQFLFNVPQNEGYTSVYLTAGQDQGWVEVHKNSATGTLAYIFKGNSENGTGMYIVDCQSLTNFLFVDQVAAAKKPTSDGTDAGIKVQGASGTLRIEAQTNDKLIEYDEGISPRVSVNNFQGVTLLGNSISNLVIRTNDVVANAFYPNGGTDVIIPGLSRRST